MLSEKLTHFYKLLTTMASKKAPKVLIVEDHLLNLRLFRDILVAKGYYALEDHTGEEAFNLAQFHQPQLIILDIILPYRSGLEILQDLKKDSRTQHIPVIGVTALAVSDIHQQMRALGCVDCLTKPFSLDTFLKTIDKAVTCDKVVELKKRKTLKAQEKTGYHDPVGSLL